jgi:hypothetical protein
MNCEILKYAFKMFGGFLFILYLGLTIISPFTLDGPITQTWNLVIIGNIFVSMFLMSVMAAKIDFENKDD